MIAVAQPFADALSVIAWATLASIAVLLVRRVPPGRRAAWALVAMCCGVVAADKAIDIQTALYVLGQRAVRALDPALGLREHRALVRVVLVVPAVAVVVWGGLALIRRNGAWGRSERFALGGLGVVIVYVSLRLLPAMDQHVDSATDQLVEVAALISIAHGARLAWPRPNDA